MAEVLIGIGSNIEAVKNMKKCAGLLRQQWPDIEFSSVYRSAPRDYEEQNDFLNAVAMIEADETPEDVHKKLKTIEEGLEKFPPFRFGPRTIDLDILLFGDEEIHTYALTVPHPRMHERRFVLEPLAELDPTWKEELEHVGDQKCKKTDLTL